MIYKITYRAVDTAGNTSINVIRTVNFINNTPIANAGSSQTVIEGNIATLDASGSSDIDLDTLTYAWTAPEGITLSSATDIKPTFTAPEVAQNKTYNFSLVVNDGTVNSAVSTVAVTVSNINNTPIANAGSAQTVNEGAIVTLDASGSSDVDLDSLTYAWTAPEGITLSSVTDINPTFTAPEVTESKTYELSLIVNDGTRYSSVSIVKITVNNVVKDSPSITIVKSEGKPFSFGFKSIDKLVYSIEVSQDLKSWEQIGSINGTGEDVIFTDNREPQLQGSINLYRIRIVE